LAGAQCHLAEDDDISLSSIEDDKHDDDENHNDEERVEEGETEKSKEQDSNDDDDENDDIVDLTKSPQRVQPNPTQPSTTSTKPITDDDDDPQRQSQLRRFARIAKKFKRQYLQKSSQYKEQYTEKRRLSDRVRHVEGELTSIQKEMSELEQDRRLTELKLNESRLNLIRIQQERDIITSRYSTMAKEKSKAETRFQECHSHYKKELETARAKSMSEVQEILKEHPKVVEENRVLKQRLQKLNRSLSRGSSSNNISCSSEISNGCQFKDINKALRQMDQQIRSRQNTATSITATKRNGSSLAGNGSENRKNEAGTQANLDSSQYRKRISGSSNISSSHSRGSVTLKVNSGQYSSLASRMMKASQKAKRPLQSSVAGKKRSSVTSLSLSQNKRMKIFSASRRDLFQRKP